MDNTNNNTASNPQNSGGSSAFSGGTKVTFNNNGTYSSGPINSSTTQKQKTVNAGPKGSNSYAKTTNMTPKKIFLYAFLGALLACVLVIAGIAIYNAVTGKNIGGTVLGSSGNTAITQSDDADTLAEAVANKCLPSVVAINVYTNQSSSSSLYGNSSNSSGSLTLSSKGSGVVISNDGHVITNHHVIDGAAQIKVNVGGEEIEADLVGADESSDVAVVKLKKAENLSPIELGDSDSIKVGEWVMSIGSPFGLEQSVATGIVSAKSRSQVVQSESDGSTKIYTNMIQTDAAINPGNSGGALVDAQGKLIGINTLITSSSGNYSGVGFAIPVNYAMDLAKQIIDGKTPSHAQLGVTLASVTSSNAKQYGFAVDKGAYVNGVTSGGPADKAGIKVGDIITKLGDTKVESPSDLQLAVRSHNPNETVEVTYYRGNEQQTCQVTLGSDEGKTQQKSNSNSGSDSSGNSNGYSLDDIFKYFFGY